MKPAPLAATSTDRTYKAGFGPVTLACEGGAYVAPLAGALAKPFIASAVGVSNAKLNFTLGGLDTEMRQFMQPLRIYNPTATGLTNLVTVLLPNTKTVKVTAFTASTGEFTGTYVIPASSGPATVARTVSYFGQMVPTTSVGSQGFGYFLLPQIPVPPQTITTSPILSGRVEFLPNIAP
jgi:hypothetical protein